MENGFVQSLERAFSILETLAKQPKGIGLVELSGMVGLHKSTTHRFLSSLCAMGYVVKDSFSGRYRLTFKVMELSNNMLNDIDILTVAKPHLDRLSHEVSESVHLVMPDGAQVVYIYKTDSSNRSFQMRSKVGLRAPMYCTAVGKSILATMTEQQIAAIWAQSEVSAMTHNTIVELEPFLKELSEIRGRGWAFDKEENEDGVSCIGVSISDYQGHAIAAMSISAPSAQMADEHIEALLPAIFACRDNIYRDMGIS